jgi:hypothetical protein
MLQVRDSTGGVPAVRAAGAGYAGVTVSSPCGKCGIETGKLHVLFNIWWKVSLAWKSNYVDSADGKK